MTPKEIYTNISLESMEGEIWVDISGFDGAYSISNFGRCRRNYYDHYSFFKGGLFRRNNPEIVKGGWFKGYRMVSLSRKSKEKKRFIHALVAEAFIEKNKNYDTVDHINMVKEDNRVSNLRWTTRSQNALWAHESGAIGNRYPPKFTKDQVIAIFNDKRILSEIAKEYNVHKSTIHLIKVGRNYSRFTGKKYERKNDRHKQSSSMANNGR